MANIKKRRGRPPGSKNKKRGRPPGSTKKGFANTLANINSLAKQLEQEMIKAIKELAKGVL